LVDFAEIERAFHAEDPGVTVTRADEVPPNYASITDAWLTDVLCKGHPGAEVTGHGLDERDDGTSNRRRIFLYYNAAGNAAGLPASVFCKSAETLQNRLSMASSGISRFEPDFFTHCRERLEMDAPRAWYAGHDPANHAYLVMLHDMTGEVEFCDHLTPVNRARAESMVEQLARLHSRFYQSPELETASIPFMNWTDYWERLMKLAPQFAQYCDIAFGDAEDLLPPELYARRSDIWRLTDLSVEAQRNLPHTLCHGDVHLKNWYVRPGDRMGLNDWQALNCGHWSRDLVYALMTALTIEDRQAWFEDLLRLYVSEMQARGVAGIGFEEAMLNCRQQSFTALAFWTITYRPAPGMPDMQPVATTREFLRRIGAAMLDMDALGSFG
jgi:aminoglycoside phosphotransferase